MIIRTSTLKGKLGFTLVELIITVAVFMIIMPIIITFFISITRSFTSHEVANQLKKTNQESLNKIYTRLEGCKRIFQNTTTDNLFVNRIQISPSCPVKLTGSKLPIIETNGCLSPSATYFATGSVGNSLFFANNDTTQILENIADANTSTHTVYIDTYRFYYYYLTSDNPKTIRSKQSYRLVEWKSVRYADWNQLVLSTDTIKRTNTAKSLYANGILYCWNPSKSDPSVDAFYTLSAVGDIIMSSTHNIARDKYNILTEMSTGIMGGGYRYGISPNSVSWSDAPKVVPQYALPSGNFPGGFEVVVVGSADGREVLVRSVIVSQGSMRSTVGDERVIVCSIRDLW